jgi:amino acid transporter
MNAVFLSILLIGLLIGLICVCLGVMLLFKRGRGKHVELELKHFGKIKTTQTGFVLVFLGIFLFVFSASGFNQAKKAEKLRTQLDQLMIATAENLHDEFHLVVDYKRRPVPAADFNRVESLIEVLQQIDKRNGHVLYYKGEVARAEGMTGEEQSYFYEYLEVQKTIPENEKGGDTSWEICYTRPRGFCKQRSGWIHHLLANDFYSDATNATNLADRQYSFNLALEQVTNSLNDYPHGFGGPGQGIPTIVLKEKLSKEIQVSRK